VYGQAEIGDDIPQRGFPNAVPGRVRPGRLARRWVIALIIGILAGAAIMLQVRAWGTLTSEAGGACGTSDQGVSYGACPRGITPALIISFFIGLPAVPAAFVLLWRKGLARRGFLAVGVAGGLLAGQSLFGIWHGTDLAVAWVAPHDSSSQLTTVGAWAGHGSVIRIRVDEAVSYDAATGAQQWALQVPGTDVACSISNDTGAIGLIAYGQDSTSCDHVMGVDLATGRQLWTDPVSSPYSGNNPTGVLAIAGSTAIVLTDNGIAGIDAQSGRQRWTASAPSDCSFQQVDAAGATAIAMAACAGSFWVVSLDPATGKAAWRYHVTEPSDSYQFQVLSVSPTVINDDLTGPRGTSTVRVFAPGGAVTAAFPVSGIPDSAASGPLALDTASTDGFGAPDVIIGNTLVGVASDDSGHGALVAFSLAGGQRQWVTPLPDEVHDLTAGGSAAGGEVVLVDESDPAYSLEEASVTTGKLASLGYFGQQALQSGDSGLYTTTGSSGTYYVIVNQDGDGDNPPAAAIRAPVVKG
jgi:outer membrane protein assembly factor BamB